MAPAFFLPYLSPDLEEACYTHLARRCGRTAPALGARIYSISFNYSGALWIATVGEILKGSAPIRLNGQETDSRQLIKDTAMILAIFPDGPYSIVTAGCSNKPSLFTNPFYATPTGIELFSTPT